MARIVATLRVRTDGDRAMPGTRARRGLNTVLVTVVVAVGVAVLVSLGLWQLERGAEKERMQSAFDSRASAPSIEMDGTLLAAEGFEYSRVSVDGVFETDRQFLVDNRIHEGRPGFHVITPLLIAGSDVRVLVNRGWIPWSQDRTRVPRFETPEGPLQVRGMLKEPASDFYTLEKSRPGPGARIWQNLDLAHFRDLVDFPVQPMIIRLDPDSGAGGFVRDWPTYGDDWIARHRGYAVQWFGLAVVLIVVSVAVAWRSRRQEDVDGS